MTPAIIRIAPNPDGIPDALKRRDQWVLFRTRRKPNGKLDKIPVNPTITRCENERCCKPGSNYAKFHDASVSDPTTWGTYEAVLRIHRAGGFAGIGFVVTEADDLVGIDLDGCRDPKTGAIEPWAQAIVDELDTYTEPSVSGTGLRLFAFGTLPAHGRRKGPIEMYSAGRFFTITGQPIGAHEIRNCNDTLTALHKRIFGEARPPKTTPAPVPGLTLDDTEVLARATRAANGHRFTALYAHGDTSGYGGDDSAADLALANDLRFWSGADPEQMDRLFRQSALMREKWDEKRGEVTYGQLTITRALPGEIYTPAGIDTITAPPATCEAPATPDPRQAEIDRLRDELAEVKAVNRGIISIVRSEATPATKIASIELAIELHTARPENLLSIEAIARRINQSDDSVSNTLKAYRRLEGDDAGDTDTAPVTVSYTPPTRTNPWTGVIGTEPHSYLRALPAHERLSDTLAAFGEIPDELRKKPRADRSTKAAPAQIPAEQIPPCPDDIAADSVQHPEIVQVARCDDCGGVLAAMTEDGVLLIPSTEIIGTGNPDPHDPPGRGLSYLSPDKSGPGDAASQARAEWVQSRIDRDRVRRHLDQVQLWDGTP
jgi:hypothetical protein